MCLWGVEELTFLKIVIVTHLLLEVKIDHMHLLLKSVDMIIKKEVINH